MSAETAPLLICADEVARMMGVSERTLWRLASAGSVPEPVRIGRNTRWRLAEIREWIERGCPNAARLPPGAKSP
jgi:excisionase family DNA binding protein